MIYIYVYTSFGWIYSLCIKDFIILIKIRFIIWKWIFRQMCFFRPDPSLELKCVENVWYEGLHLFHSSFSLEFSHHPLRASHKYSIKAHFIGMIRCFIRNCTKENYFSLGLVPSHYSRISLEYLCNTNHIRIFLITIENISIECGQQMSME